ncbi:hypothetical protein SMICM17S_11748 [Streptomyces microflavus]
MSVCISAILLLPFSLPAAPSVNGYDWGLVVFSGIVGVALAFTLDFQAVKMDGAKVVAMLFSFDPVMRAGVTARVLRSRGACRDDLRARPDRWRRTVNRREQHLGTLALAKETQLRCIRPAQQLPVDPVPARADRSPS